MGKRIATILAPMDVGASGTRVDEIRLNEQISMLFIVWSYTVATVSDMTGHPLDCISKIEVVDGSEVLFSATGRQAQAVAFHDFKPASYNQYSATVGGTCLSVVPVLFGRKLWDDQFALRPEMFKNPQIRITYDEDAANASVVANSLAIYAYVDGQPMNGKANGYLLTRLDKTWAMAASGHEYTDLPVDKPIRRVFLQASSADHDTVTLLTNVRIDVENGKYFPYDIPANDLFRVVASMYGGIEENWTLDDAVTAETLYPSQEQDGRIAIDYDSTAFVTAQSKFSEATWTGEKLALSASVDIKKLTAITRGYLPHGVIPLDFGDPDFPETWLQVSGVNNIRADIEASSDADSGDTAALIVQQPVQYGRR